MDEPIFEISFMPAWLATNHSDAHTVTHYKGITAPPKNYSEWGGIIERMATHLKERYPAKKIMWEVWKYAATAAAAAAAAPRAAGLRTPVYHRAHPVTVRLYACLTVCLCSEPNGGFWSPGPEGDILGRKPENKGVQQEAYFRLYKETADALKRVSATNNLVGGPATAGCPGWTADLLAFAEANHTAVDFGSCHTCGGGGAEWDVGSLHDTLSAMPSTKQQAKGLPVVITEWSSSWSYKIEYHDLPASAAFIVAARALGWMETSISHRTGSFQTSSRKVEFSRGRFMGGSV